MLGKFHTGLRRFRSFLNHPGASVRGRLRPILRSIMLRWSEFCLQRSRYLDFVEQRPPRALPPDPADLWYLYQMVRSRKPKVVLEFGSGCSTVILAQALFDNSSGSSELSGFLYSLDVSPEWMEVTLESMPEYLRGLVEIRPCQAVIVEHNGKRVFRHLDVPRVPIDMLYLDSPPGTPDIRIAIDPIDLEDLFQPGFVGVVDGRDENVEYLKHNLLRQYKFTHNWVRHNTVFYLLE